MTQIKATLPTPETDFGARWCEMMDAVKYGQLSQDEMKAVLFNVVEYQQTVGWQLENNDGQPYTERLRTDRFEYEVAAQSARLAKRHMAPNQWKARKAAMTHNDSDRKILAQMERYAKNNEAGMEMTGVEMAWFVYVTEGGDKPEPEKLTEDEKAMFGE